MKRRERLATIMKFIVIGAISFSVLSCGSNSSTDDKAEKSSPLVLIETIPVSGQKGVAPTSDFRLTFNNPVDLRSVQLPSRDGSCDGPVQLSADHFHSCLGLTVDRKKSGGAEMVFHSTSKMSLNADYTLSISPGLIAKTGEKPLERREVAFSTLKGGIVGLDYAGRHTEMARVSKKGLPGALKMSGRWVSHLNKNQYLVHAGELCRYAGERSQQVLFQLPLHLSLIDLEEILSKISRFQCEVMGISVGNEVDRLVIDGIFTRYDLNRYNTHLSQIVPLIRRHLPTVAIIGFELSSFDSVPDWIQPFCASSNRELVDLISIHFYPFTGGQKRLENLFSAQKLRSYLNTIPASCPKILLGEFNTTYQYEAGMAYEGSGGDSFFISLNIPEIAHSNRVSGLVHWSFMEAAPSTLGLYKLPGLEPRPMLTAYQFLFSTRGRTKGTTSSLDGDLHVSDFFSENEHTLFLANHSPVVKRDVSIASEGNPTVRVNSGAAFLETVVDLAPFSLTKVTINAGEAGSITERFSHVSRTPTQGEFTAAEKQRDYCVTIADFSEPDLTADHFSGNGANQNKKVATGGTYYPNRSPAASINLEETGNALRVNCQIDASDDYFQCGVGIPLFSEEYASTTPFINLSELENGFIRIVIETTSDTRLYTYLEDTDPGGTGYNTHRKDFQVNGLQTVDISVDTLRQEPGWGVSRSLGTVLKKASKLRIESREPDSTTSFSIRKIDLCDRY